MHTVGVTHNTHVKGKMREDPLMKYVAYVTAEKTALNAECRKRVFMKTLSEHYKVKAVMFERRFPFTAFL